jgi:hypothetical protein
MRGLGLAVVSEVGYVGFLGKGPSFPVTLASTSARATRLGRGRPNSGRARSLHAKPRRVDERSTTATGASYAIRPTCGWAGHRHGP